MNLHRLPTRQTYRPQVEWLEDRTLLAAGDLDATFGAGGLVMTDFSSTPDQGNAIAAQADGKFVVAGSVAGNFALARYHPNGSLDTTFGTGGKVATDFGAADAASAVAVQPDGKIVVAGTTGNDFALARYLPSGSLDPGFGTNGKVTTDFGSADQASDLVLQPDNRIVVAGTTGAKPDRDFALARYEANGAPDNTFGTAGKVITAFTSFTAGSNDDRANAVALQADGKIVVAGTTGNGSIFVSGYRQDFALARYNSDGSPDVTFAPFGTTPGRLTTDLFGSDVANDVLLQADGKIIAAGYAGGENNDGNSNRDLFALARYHSDGGLDASFGQGGKVTTPFDDGPPMGQLAQIHAVTIQADGKLVAGGSVVYSYADFALMRYHANGSLDGTFGVGGKIRTNFGMGVGGTDYADTAEAVLLQEDGKIVLAGWSDTTSGRDFALARYLDRAEMSGGGPEGTNAMAPLSGDVSAVVSVQRVSLQRGRKGRVRIVLSVRNISGRPLQGPVTLSLEDLTRHVRLHAPSGTTQGGSPYVILLPPGAELPAGGSTGVVLIFATRSGQRLRFSTRVIAGPGVR